MKTQTIFVLSRGVQCEGGYVESVHPTRSRAEEAAKALMETMGPNRNRDGAEDREERGNRTLWYGWGFEFVEISEHKMKTESEL